MVDETLRYSNSKQWLIPTLLAVFALFLLCTGGFIAGVAFHDPDTCWLLALGRWIVQHHCLPAKDPLSAGVAAYACLGRGLPLVQYQWLAEVAFYCIFAAGGPAGLTVLTALLLAAAYIVIPWNMLSRSRAPYAVSLSLTVLSVVLASSRFLARPQIFSFLLFSALISVMLARDFHDKRIVRQQAFAATAIMALWVNCHIFFPLGLAFIWLVCARNTISDLFSPSAATKPSWAEWARSAGSMAARPAEPAGPAGSAGPAEPAAWLWWLAAPVGGTLATLFNPWGAGIWVYFLRILRSPVNDIVLENAKLPLSDYSAILLLIFAGAVLFFAARQATTAVSRRSSSLFAAVLVLLALAIGLSHSRLISFSPLLLMGACAELFFASSGQRLPDTAAGANEIWCQTAWKARTTPEWLFHTINVCLVAAGAILTTSLIAPTLPQSSAGFRPPFKAIDYLQTHRPQGHLLNDPQFGSVMSWYLPQPDLFIDTRFSMYDEQRVLDYQRLSLAQPGWQDLLERYRFDWAFLPPAAPIARCLMQRGWKTAYSDGLAVILTKT